LPNAQYQSIASAASLSAILTQQENTFARASYDKAIFKALRYDFCFSSSWTAWEKTIGLISKGSLPAGKLITHRLPLSEWETAFHLLENLEAAKIILLP